MYVCMSEPFIFENNHWGSVFLQCVRSVGYCKLVGGFISFRNASL
jgi:hypothetical protein